MTFKQLQGTKPVDFAPQYVSFLSSESETDRIQLQYHHNSNTGTVYATVRFGPKAQGPPGHAHGGAISAVFDEIMGATCWFNQLPALTAQYTTRFFKTLPLEQTVLFESHIKAQDEEKIKLKTRVMDTNGIIYAEAKGLFIAMDGDKFERLFGLKVH